MSSALADPARHSPVRGGKPQRLRVHASTWRAVGITSYELRSVDGTELPQWAAGAHVDVHLPSGTVRQYSLCGDPTDLSHYRIAVLEQPTGRGGSIEVHRELRPGVEVEIGAPRADFTLVQAERYVFVAGGIGVTPLLPMVREVHGRGGDWRLVYAARTPQHAAFLLEFLDLDADRVQLVTEERNGRPDLASIVAGSTGAQVYCCGPAGLMEALEAEMAVAGRAEELHLERFAPSGGGAVVADDGRSGGAVQVELAASGLVIDVPPEQSLLEGIRAAGVDHPSSCEMGFCGTCEVKVLAGDVEHRDDLLTPEEQASGCMLICVSRARSARLVLDV